MFRIWPETAVGLTLQGKKPGAGWEPQAGGARVRAAARVGHPPV